MVAGLKRCQQTERLRIARFNRYQRAVDIRNGDDDDLELHVNSRDARVFLLRRYYGLH
jgi:hypothetical protein